MKKVDATLSEMDRKPAPPARPRVVLADDNGELLADISDFLSGDFEIIGSAGDGASLVELAAKLRPDVVVTDLQMPRLSGIDAGRRILEGGICKVVVVLTIFSDAKLAKRALDSGILGYVLKVNAGEDLIPAINAALGGRTFVSSAVASNPAD